MPAAPSASNRSYRLAVSAFDRTSSLIVTGLILGSVFVLGLVIVYVTLQLVDTTVAVPVNLAASRPATAAAGHARDVEPPGSEEAPELLDPQLPETLSAIAEAVSSREALLSEDAFEADTELGHGQGLGDSRQAGTGGEGPIERVPRSERWRIRYMSPESLDAYAAQLDFFGIEIAMLGRDGKVYYAYNFSKASPDIRVTDGQNENRIRFIWITGKLKSADAQLLQRAGLSLGNQVMVQYIPHQLDGRLFALEKEHAKGRDVNDIRQTVFRVEREGQQFVIRVQEQHFF